MCSRVQLPVGCADNYRRICFTKWFKVYNWNGIRTSSLRDLPLVDSQLLLDTEAYCIQNNIKATSVTFSVCACECEYIYIYIYIYIHTRQSWRKHNITLCQWCLYYLTICLNMGDIGTKFASDSPRKSCAIYQNAWNRCFNDGWLHGLKLVVDQRWFC